MSSYPQHEDNLKDLKRMGFDVTEYSEDPMESWDYDSLVYLVQDLIGQIGGIKPKWIRVKDKTPTNEKNLYWVLFPSGKLIMCHLNDYRRLGGPVNYWQDMISNDLLMDGTEYMEIIKPEPPK